MKYTLIYLFYFYFFDSFIYKLFISCGSIVNHSFQPSLLDSVFELRKIEFNCVQLRRINWRKNISNAFLFHKFYRVFTGMNFQIVQVQHPVLASHLLIQLLQKAPELLLVNTLLVQLVVDNTKTLTYPTDESFVCYLQLVLVDLKILPSAAPLSLLPSLSREHCFIKPDDVPTFFDC